MKNTNALAELAHWLECDTRTLETVSLGQLNRIRKAKRIIAELAKVEKPIDRRTVGMTHLADILDADKNRAVEIVRNCRAIAEKGAEDGK